MSAIEIRLPDSLLPGSPPALAELERLCAEHEGQALRLDGAWMLDALPRRREALRELATRGELSVVQRYCRVDAFALSGWREVNAHYAEELASAFPGVVLEEPRDLGASGSGELGEASLRSESSDPAGDRAAISASAVTSSAVGSAASSHLARAGLCVELRVLADRLMPRIAVRSAFEQAEAAMLPQVLAALSPAGLGGAGDATSEAAARAALRAACAALEINADQELRAPSSAREIRGRVRRLELESPRLALAWGRSKGLRMQLGSLRECSDAFALEVQGDRGGRGAHLPGHPERPRVFLASDMTPLVHDVVDGVGWLVLERELRLPLRADDPAGRKGYVRWRLTLRLDIERGGLDAEVVLQDPVPGQRYRLWVPVPFHPRPSKLIRVECDGRFHEDELDGPWPTSAVMLPLSLRGQGHELQVGALGLREAEVFARRNDHVCALTLLRTHTDEAPPPHCVRRVRLSARASGHGMGMD